MILIIAMVAIVTCYYDILCLSPTQQVIAGERLSIPQTSGIKSWLPQITLQKQDLQFEAEPAIGTQQLDLDIEETATTNYELQLRAGGILPLKTITVEEIAPLEVVVGGHSIGILLQTEGVTVVGHSAVISGEGTAAYPAKDAGIKVGDFVTDINGITISTNAQIRDLIHELGQKGDDCTIHYYREGLEYEVELTPEYCSDSETWRIGLYVRDNTAGVGTLTFYEPNSGIYGALGHTVSDLEYGVEGEQKGLIVRAAIQGIKNGVRGEPGEKLGVFIGSDWQGTIETNGSFGIFGHLQQAISNDKYRQTVTIALPEQVESGHAQILTVLEGEEIEAFDIEIIKTMPNYKSSGKGMIIEIIDERLLEATGGIVQGMSGSPIIQNGSLIGAVTHVFINDPTKGYACFATWMLEEAGIL